MGRVIFLWLLALLLLKGYSATSIYPQHAYSTSNKLVTTSQNSPSPEFVRHTAAKNICLLGKEFEDEERSGRLVARKYNPRTNYTFLFTPVFDPANGYRRTIDGLASRGYSPGIYITQRSLRI